jgi:Tfp pilus assembly protein PilN
VLAWIVGPGLAGWLFWSTSSQLEELNLKVEEAVQDSARYAVLIARQDQLRARRDTVAEKLTMIQEIDAGRYVWPHLMDEISRALPDYTWLTALTSTTGEDDGPAFELTGRTGNTFALTRFMNDLEASPFIREVKLTRTEQVRDKDDRTVHEFVLTARYEEPPADLVTTVPLFAKGED